ISRVDISRKTGLSKPVVSIVTSRLIKNGLIKEVGEGKSTKKTGRRPIMLSFVPDYMYVVGLDIGGTKLEGVLADLEGNIVDKIVAPTKDVHTEKDLYDLVSHSVKALIKGRKNKILGIGIGVPGTVDWKTGIINYMPAFELRNVNLKDYVQKKFDLTVLIENDVNLDALAESKIGAGKGFKYILMVSIGTGTGAGLILNGAIFRGSYGKAGEFGYIITDWEKEKLFSRDSFGYLEEWFSGQALERKFSEKGLGSNLKDIFDLLDKDKTVERIIKEGCEHLALAIANAIVLLNPEIVIIKGGIGYNQYEKIMAYTVPILEKVVPPEIFEDVSFRKGKLERFGVALGGVFLVIEEILKI
ncbi:MAG: ROK family transcriptional regulator, partial [Thermotoga sp.]